MEFVPDPEGPKKANRKDKGMARDPWFVVRPSGLWWQTRADPTKHTLQSAEVMVACAQGAIPDVVIVSILFSEEYNAVDIYTQQELDLFCLKFHNSDIVEFLQNHRDRLPTVRPVRHTFKYRTVANT